MGENALLREVLELEATISKEVRNLVFPAARKEMGAAEYAVHQLADTAVARDNCHVSSEAILNGFNFAEKLTQVEAIVSGIETPAGNHVGVLLTRKTGQWSEDNVMIDYSARQFDPDIAFPLIMDAWEWQEWVESKLGRQGEWTHLNDWYLER